MIAHVTETSDPPESTLMQNRKKSRHIGSFRWKLSNHRFSMSLSGRVLMSVPGFVGTIFVGSRGAGVGVTGVLGADGDGSSDMTPFLVDLLECEHGRCAAEDDVTDHLDEDRYTKPSQSGIIPLQGTSV